MAMVVEMEVGVGRAEAATRTDRGGPLLLQLFLEMW